ncbi:MAG TPA: hypothetical protein VLG47_05235 [Candidatus Saccharimonadales bacterium]|nr:hypothetical protein [Candidatus Saccharimonadales bacterium]
MSRTAAESSIHRNWPHRTVQSVGALLIVPTLLVTAKAGIELAAAESAPTSAEATADTTAGLRDLGRAGECFVIDLTNAAAVFTLGMMARRRESSQLPLH